jgi:tetratricopeptide (TPR) repeat protein
MALRLLEEFKAESIPVRINGEVRRVPCATLLDGSYGTTSIARIAALLEQSGVVDPDLLTPPELLVDMTFDAPRPDRFVGRVDDLDVLTSANPSPRLVIVRGIAGIGKTWLAAEACRRMRGTRNLFWHQVRPWDTNQSLLIHLGEFLAALGKPALRAVLMRGLAGRVAEILRHDLRESNAFIVIDDAHLISEEAMTFFRILKEALVSAPDVRVVVSTRRALPFYDRRDVVLGGLVRELDLGSLEMSDVVSFLSTDGGPILSSPFRSRVLGHPLLLELYRAHRFTPEDAGGDVRQFVEEVIYTELLPAERGMMGLASLYEVPVPHEALFADPEWSNDIVLSLTNRCLLRSIGDGRFEVHDTIREIFLSLLAPTARRTYAEFATRQLDEMASRAWDSRLYEPCANYLSNAVRLAHAPGDKLALLERLGDVDARTGDLLALSVAFHQALKIASESEIKARLHRKLARALGDHGEFDAAVAEIEAGEGMLKGRASVERGWFDLIRAQIANRTVRPEETVSRGTSAMAVFRVSGDVEGQALAAYVLAEANSVLGTPGPDGRPTADKYYREALRLSDKFSDPAFAVRVHLSMAGRLGQRYGDEKRVLEHLASIEALADGLADPFVRMDILHFRCWFKTALQLDFMGAENDGTAAVRLATRLGDPMTAAEAKYMLAGAIRWQGRLEEASLLFEEAARELNRLDEFPGRTLSILFSSADCLFILGNRPGWDRLLACVEELFPGSRAQLEYGMLFEAFDCLLRKDHVGVDAAFEAAFKILQPRSQHGVWYLINTSTIEFYYAVALRIMGRTEEALKHRNRALEMFRACNLHYRLQAASEWDRQLVDGISGMIQSR